MYEPPPLSPMGEIVSLAFYEDSFNIKQPREFDMTLNK